MPLFSAANRTWESHLERNRGLIFTNIICGMQPKMNVFFFFPSLIPVSIALSLFNQTFSVARKGGGEGGIV